LQRRHPKKAVLSQQAHWTGDGISLAMARRDGLSGLARRGTATRLDEADARGVVRVRRGVLRVHECVQCPAVGCAVVVVHPVHAFLVYVGEVALLKGEVHQCVFVGREVQAAVLTVTSQACDDGAV
jgi:hypothetical protein